MSGELIVYNLEKYYKCYPSNWARLKEWLTFDKRTFHEKKWVIKDISFSVARGETLGIIGINGAGKSTLLKLITGSSKASSGSVQKKGVMASILELGIGFQLELTGRQNIFLLGQLQGMKNSEIADKIESIEDFAEIGDYLDHPVRTYSTGMQARLAFSVATVQRPDILILDEILSVGDVYFQNKCFKRIREFKANGTSIILVSHDKQAIHSICDRAILLYDGLIAMEGNPENVMNYYNALLASNQNQTIVKNNNIKLNGKNQTISGNRNAKIIEIKLVNYQNKITEIVYVGNILTLELRIITLDSLDKIVVGFMIKDRVGNQVYGTNTFLKDVLINNINKDEMIVIKFSFTVNLGEGDYSFTTAITSTENHLENNYEWIDQALTFSVVNKDYKKFIGTAWLDSKVKIERSEKNV